jgi:hypothetical protein
VEHHLILFHRALVEHVGGDVLGRNVDALGLGVIQHIREQPHLELEAENIDAGDVLLAAFENHFFNEQARHRHIDRPDRHQPSRLLAVEGAEAIGLLGAIGAQDQVEESGFLLLQLPALFFVAQIGIHADVVLALVLAKVEDFKSAIGLVFGLLQLPVACQSSVFGLCEWRTYLGHW